MPRACFVLGILIVLPLCHLRGAEPPAALTVRLVQPDQQCEHILALFQGARAPHPAAALAAWRRATGATLGKPAEALIAVFNPGMVNELKTVDNATVVLGFDAADGRLRWHASLPRDDGTFASLATALVLTDGASDAPLDATGVDRLGPPGAPLMARTGERVVLAGTRDDLRAALVLPPRVASTPSVSGLSLQFEPGELAKSGPISARLVNEALRALGCRTVQGRVAVEDDALELDLRANLDNAPGSAAIDPSWLKWISADSALAAVSLRINPRPDSWDRVFALADRVERVDPARAGLAPLRTRLNLAAAAVKVRPEVDLWPVLRGVSIGVFADADGTVSGAVVVLHTVDSTAAERLGETVLPRLLASFVPPAPSAAPVAEGRSLGRIGGRSLRLALRDETVVLGWGEGVLGRALDAQRHPERSVAGLLHAHGSAPPPSRAGIFWPERLRGLAGTTFAQSHVPPVMWWGRNEGKTSRDVVRWSDLRALVHHFLEKLPLDPPPDH